MTVLRSEPVVVVNPDPERVVRVGQLEIDVAAIAVRCAGTRINLPLREFQVLLLLADNAGHTLSPQALGKHVWGEDVADVAGNLKIHISRLRQRIRAAGGPECIRTIRGVGYCLDTS